MLFDTDILIWVQRGNTKALKRIEKTDVRTISILTYMELLQGAQSKQQHKMSKDFLNVAGFHVLGLSEKIGHRAAIYVEEFALSHGLRAADALIAATAVEEGLPLVTGNGKHFRCIKELELSVFKP